MRFLLPALSVEFLKIRKSRVWWISAVAFSIAPLMGGLFMYILMNPESPLHEGLLAAKAEMASMELNWVSMIGFLGQAMGVGGIILFGFVASWLFGREYSDSTVKDLLALPARREVIVLAKFIAMFLWCLFLMAVVLVVGFLSGWLVGIPGFSFANLGGNILIYFEAGLLTTAVSTPVAFFASMGKGYLAPLGVVALFLVFAQILAALGMGAWFPWSVPAIHAGMAGTGGSLLSTASYLILFIVSMAGIAGTVWWWRVADQK
jgi:ABC-2 type transport system permease protein